MAILRLIKSEQGREAYDAVAAIVDIEHKHPLGLIMHGATEVNGKMQIAEVWESKEYARRFDEEHLWPAVEAAGVSRNANITIFELQNLVTP
jgi:sulfur relay (sulfurtransferase) DsrF/TusC family protein